MKVLIAIDIYKNVINGVVTSTNTLIDGLVKRGHEVRILSLSENGKSYQEGNNYFLGSTSVGFIYPNMRIRTASFKKVFNDLVNWKPDVIHTQSEFSTFYLARKLSKALNIPIVHTYHTMYEEYTHYFSWSKRAGKAMIRAFSRYICNKAKIVIAPSMKIKELLTNYGVEKPIKVIPTGIDFDSSSCILDKDWIKLKKQEYRIDKSKLVLIYVGRLGEEKNIAELITGMVSLKDEKVSLLIVGDGPDKLRLQELVKKLDLEKSVIFTGMVPHVEVGSYYHLGDVFVSASTSETQGLTYLEALAASRPLVCRYDSCLDGVVLDSENGFVYDSVQTLVDRVRLLMNNKKLRMKMGRKAEEVVKSKYSVKNLLTIFLFVIMVIKLLTKSNLLV